VGTYPPGKEASSVTEDSSRAVWLRQARSYLRKAARAAYQLDHLPAEQEVLAIASKWRPYRSLATSYLFSAAFEPAEAPPAA
jgi:hypothetical protein